MAWSLAEAFEKDAIMRAHLEHRCNFDECPYCHMNFNIENEFLNNEIKKEVS